MEIALELKIVIISIALVHSLFWGYVTSTIIENKKHPGKGWFWWGFFFGVFAMAIALTLPEEKKEERQRKLDAVVIGSGGWKCGFCGHANDSNLGTCICGKTKEETIGILNDLQNQAAMMRMGETEHFTEDLPKVEE